MSDDCEEDVFVPKMRRFSTVEQKRRFSTVVEQKRRFSTVVVEPKRRCSTATAPQRRLSSNDDIFDETEFNHRRRNSTVTDGSEYEPRRRFSSINIDQRRRYSTFGVDPRRRVSVTDDQELIISLKSRSKRLREKKFIQKYFQVIIIFTFFYTVNIRRSVRYFLCPSTCEKCFFLKRR